MCKAVEHSKNNFNKLAVVAHVLHATQNLVILRRRYAENGKEMYQYSNVSNVRAQPMFYS